MGQYGILQVGERPFEVDALVVRRGLLCLVAWTAAPAELAVDRAVWYGPDGTEVCAFDRFRFRPEEVTNARTANYRVTVYQPIHITVNQPAAGDLPAETMEALQAGAPPGTIGTPEAGHQERTLRTR